VQPLHFYNSLTKKIELFKPRRDEAVRVYHCGPTVYRRQHIGNMRRNLFADFLRRTLEFSGLSVADVMNITDVGHLTQDDIDAGEDKLEVAARERKMTPADIAGEQIKNFFADLEALNIKRAQHYPRATEHIEQMQRLIHALLKRGHAYQTASGVYFDVTSFPSYGRLSGNKLEEMAAGHRVDVREEKRHPADFALWKIADPGHVQQWDSPWGRGYPGWHIECSAMSLAYLGSAIDIHTGGEDNRFPHHENEIAQSEGATGKQFVRFWMHNAFLNLKGAKLAKRTGEQITLETLTERGYSPLAFRLLTFGVHYRQIMEFSWQALDAAQENLASWRQLLRRLRELSPPDDAEFKADPPVVAAFLRALSDDLNTPSALAAVMGYMKELNKKLASGKDGLSAAAAGGALLTLRRLDQVLGVIEPLEHELTAESVPAVVQRLAEERETARQAGDFAKADKIRRQVETMGYVIEDTPTTPRVIRK
jgi:cysteinyl-tRNA synthetase